MFSGQSAEIFQVARYYNVSPTELLDWPNPLFIEAREFMEVCNEIEYRRAEGLTDDNSH